MSQWRFFRVGLGLFLFFSLSAGVARASMRESTRFAQDLWREILAFIPAATATDDEGAGTEPEDEPSEEGDQGSEMDPHG